MVNEKIIKINLNENSFLIENTYNLPEEAKLLFFNCKKGFKNLNKSINKIDNLAKSLFEKGLSHLKNNEIDQAIKSLKIAVEKDTKNSLYYLSLAEAMERKGWINFAKHQYKMILTFDPNNKVALEKLNLNQNKPNFFKRLFKK